MSSRYDPARSIPRSPGSSITAGSSRSGAKAPAGRRAKYYALTRSGRSQLERESEQWRRLSSAVTTLLDTV